MKQIRFLSLALYRNYIQFHVVIEKNRLWGFITLSHPLHMLDYASDIYGSIKHLLSFIYEAWSFACDIKYVKETRDVDIWKNVDLCCA